MSDHEWIEGLLLPSILCICCRQVLGVKLDNPCAFRYDSTIMSATTQFWRAGG